MIHSTHMDILQYIKSFPIKDFKRGEVLLKKGDSISTLMAIRSGYVKVTSIADTGFERLTWIAGRYDIAPTEQLFTKQGESRFYYTGLTDGEYYSVHKKDFLEKAFNEPRLMTDIARTMSSHYDDSLQRVDAIEAVSVKSRLQQTLLYLAQRLSSDIEVNIFEYGLRLTHSDLASMIGSTRETTSLILSELRAEKVIHYTRTCFIINTARIREE